MATIVRTAGIPHPKTCVNVESVDTDKTRFETFDDNEDDATHQTTDVAVNQFVTALPKK
jgi:hypothetical protein